MLQRSWWRQWQRKVTKKKTASTYSKREAMVGSLKIISARETVYRKHYHGYCTRTSW